MRTPYAIEHECAGCDPWPAAVIGLFVIVACVLLVITQHVHAASPLQRPPRIENFWKGESFPLRCSTGQASSAVARQT